MKRQTWKVYAFWIGLSEVVGAIAGFLTRNETRQFAETFDQPPLSPPMMVFPIVWAILYALMGISAARISLTAHSPQRSAGLKLFFVQLAVNFFWSLIFFRAEAFGFAFAWLMLLWVLIVVMISRFETLDSLAAWLLSPYLLWVTFAAYLNLGVWVLNG